LTAFGTTNACGWGVGDAFPLPPCHVANAGFGAEPQGFGLSVKFNYKISLKSARCKATYKCALD
jgi:hypothetical protein